MEGRLKNVYVDDLDPSTNMTYSNADGEERVERLVNIYESLDAIGESRCHHASTQDRGSHAVSHLSVQRNRFRAAALVLALLCLLLAIGLAVLSKLYVTISLEKQRLGIDYEVLSNRFCQNQDPGNQLRGNFTAWRRFQCSCYFKSTETKTWTESQSDCESRGSNLVTISSKAEQEFVSDLNKPDTSWIGLHSPNQWKPEWKWVDSLSCSYHSWGLDVPMLPPPGVLSWVYMDQDGTWNHNNHTGPKRWICKRHIY